MPSGIHILRFSIGHFPILAFFKSRNKEIKGCNTYIVLPPQPPHMQNMYLQNTGNHENSMISLGYLLLSLLPPFLLPMQAIEFFFFAACIVGVAVLFAIMAFFYEYVDLSAHNQLLINDDETSALILSHDKQQQSDSSIDDKGIESEF